MLLKKHTNKTLLMNNIIIKKNKLKFYTYFFISLLILTGTLIMSFFWCFNPSKYVYWFLPSEEIVFIVSIIGIIFSSLGLFLSFFNIFNDDFYIRISDEGIFIGILPYDNRLVKWSEINLIKEKKINSNKYLIFFVDDVKMKLFKEKKWTGRFFFKMNLNTQNTPYLLNSNMLNCSFEDLKKIVFQYWNFYKK